jgi:hypothetical protein
VSGATGVLARTFSSLGERNYRLYFLVSVSGTWIQLIA